MNMKNGQHYIIKLFTNIIHYVRKTKNTQIRKLNNTYKFLQTTMGEICHNLVKLPSS